MCKKCVAGLTAILLLLAALATPACVAESYHSTSLSSAWASIRKDMFSNLTRAENAAPGCGSIDNVEIGSLADAFFMYSGYESSAMGLMRALCEGAQTDEERTELADMIRSASRMNSVYFIDSELYRFEALFSEIYLEFYRIRAASGAISWDILLCAYCETNGGYYFGCLEYGQISSTAVGSIEQPFGESDFDVRYPGYAPFNDGDFASTRYTEDWIEANYWFSAGGYNYMVVNCDSFVTLRAEADSASARVLEAPKGAQVYVNGRWGDWMLCYYQGRYGWIMSKYLARLAEPEAELWGLAIDKLATRSGPSTKVEDTGTYSDLKGQYVKVRSRAWDAGNEIWWVEVLIGDRWLWTGYHRFDSSTLPLDSIPIR